MHRLGPPGQAGATLPTAIRAVSVLFLLAVAVAAQTADHVGPAFVPAMNPLQQEEYGRPNPDAPQELRQFAFLIGRWRCESRVKSEEGDWQTFRATWVGRYILDGYVIADEFRQFGPSGELMQLGQNYRSYNTDEGAWAMRWLDALNSTWLEVGPEERGGVQVGDSSIVFKHGLPPGPVAELFPAHTVFRITFSDISEESFNWQAEISTDGQETWGVVQVIEAERVEG